jgi:hypothetical protein
MSSEYVHRLGPELPECVMILCEQFPEQKGVQGRFALAYQLAEEGDCCCIDDPDAPEDATMGLQCDVPETWCFHCLALAAVDEIEGREPGETVMRRRAESKD